jgi:hypothetical protein
MQSDVLAGRPKWDMGEFSRAGLVMRMRAESWVPLDWQEFDETVRIGGLPLPMTL